MNQFANSDKLKLYLPAPIQIDLFAPVVMELPHITRLLNAVNLHFDPYEQDKINSQEVVDYCNARFRMILQKLSVCQPGQQSWMFRILFRELVCPPVAC